MANSRRSNDWGFPRWREYGDRDFAAATVRICDRHGCEAKGDCPAPKSPNNPDRWYFCERHAAEYNRGWNYFEGLTKEEAAAREADERAEAAHANAAHWGWGGPGDGTRSRAEMDALDLFELDPDADFEAVKRAYRAHAKLHHPDRKPGDREAARLFQAGQAAYDVLKRAEEMKEWKGADAD